LAYFIGLQKYVFNLKTEHLTVTRVTTMIREIYCTISAAQNQTTCKLYFVGNLKPKNGQRIKMSDYLQIHVLAREATSGRNQYKVNSRFKA